MIDPNKPVSVLAVTRRQAIVAAGAVATIAGVDAPRARAATPPVVADPRFTPLYPRESRTRRVRDLSGIWRFRLDPQDVGEKERWFNGLTDTRAIPVPCSWNDLFDDAANYFGAGWYETEFEATADAGRRLQLRFGSAVYRAKAWLNGRLLGEHVGGHLPFVFDVTAEVLGDRPNRLVVMVENRLFGDRVPDVPDPATAHFYQEDFPQTAYDFFPYSGLHRSVWLSELPAVHVEDIHAVTKIAGATGMVDVSVRASGGWSGPAEIVLDHQGSLLRQSLAIRNGVGRATISVPNAALWSPERPALHVLTIRLGDAATPVDEYALKVGIRTVAVSGEQLLLNGKPFQLRGFGKHEDFYIHGRGFDAAVLIRDYELLKWIGANSFRTSHYPYAEEALMLADEYGFLVIGETPAVSLIFSDPADVIERRRQQLARDIDDMIARDKNHPCVIMWSIANEPLTKPFHTVDTAPPDAVAKGTRFFADIFVRARAADRNRPVALVSVHNGPVEWVSQGDVICTNSYNGWYAVPGRIDAAAVTLSREIDALHAACGAKPIIVTEFGADAKDRVHGQPPQMWSEDYQSDLIAMYLDVLRRKPFVIGTHPWCFADFRTAQSIMRVGSMNLKGVFTRDRTPKRAAIMLRSRWSGTGRAQNA